MCVCLCKHRTCLFECRNKTVFQCVLNNVDIVAELGLSVANDISEHGGIENVENVLISVKISSYFLAV